MADHLDFLRNNLHLSYAAAAAELDLSRQRVYQICKKHNIKLTPYASARYKPPRYSPIPLTWLEKRNGLPFVYAAGEIPEGPIKIGVARDVDSRLHQLQSGNPRELKIFFKASALIPARSTELEIHKRLKEHSLGREWFLINASDAIDAIRCVIWDFTPASKRTLRCQPLDDPDASRKASAPILQTAKQLPS